MKTPVLTILLSVGLVAIISGAYFLSSAGQEPLAATIKFDPKFVEWDGAPTSTWIAWIQSADGAFNPLYVDGESVMLEHVLPANGGHYEKGRWVAEFDGNAVFDILTGKVIHMELPPDISTKTPVHYYFTVSGTLKGAKGYPDGTPFEGEGWIAVRFVSGFPSPTP